MIRYSTKDREPNPIGYPTKPHLHRRGGAPLDPLTRTESELQIRAPN